MKRKIIREHTYSLEYIHQILREDMQDYYKDFKSKMEVKDLIDCSGDETIYNQGIKIIMYEEVTNEA